jgi:predicted phage terminase large subunit-like protein
LPNVKLTADLIAGFAGGLLSKGFDEPAPTPECHREWWEMACSDHQYVAIAAPRGHAKTTALTKCYTLAAVLFRSADFVLVVSDTYNQACLFLGEIKRELTANQDLIELFGIKRDAEGNPVLLTDRENDVIVQMDDGHMFRIMALGSEQKVRGLLWNGRRPNLIVGDDLENDEIVMNSERRQKFANWVDNALLPCLSERGKVRIVGTILHMGSFLEARMPRDHSSNSIHTDLCVMMKEPDEAGWFSARYAAHGPSATFDKILWTVKWTEKRLRAKQRMYVANGNPEGYYQEYLNRPIDPFNAYFRKEDFQVMTDAERMYPWKNYPCYLSVDLAISDKQKRDWCAFGVGQTDETGMLYIRKVIRERMDSKEIVDTIMRLKQQYGFNIMLIGKGALEKAIGPFLRESIRKENKFLHLEAIPEVVDKRMGAQAIRGRMRAGGVKFDKSAPWYPTLEAEMLQFDRGQYDDQVDMMKLFGMYLDQIQTAPSLRDIEDEAWLDDNWRYLDEIIDKDKNKHTGY